MKLSRVAHSHLVSNGMIRMAALLVPREARLEWLQEWRSELWHVWHACHENAGAATPHRKEEILAFSLGAFHDAFWLRRNYSREAALAARLAATPKGVRPGTPSRCILTLIVIAAACMLVAYCRPDIWKVVRPYRFRDAGDLVIISRTGFERATFPTVQLSEYESWTRNSGRLFRGLAFYYQAPKQIVLTTDTSTALPVVRASANLFELLGIPIAFAASGNTAHHQTSIYLSRTAWLNYFHGDVHLFGRMLPVEGRQVMVAGVVDDEYWRLPGRADVWLLEDDRHLSALPPGTEGYVLAHAAPAAFTKHPDGRRQMYVARQDEGYDWFLCVSLAEHLKEPFSDFSFALLLACFALPATTSLPLGEYPVHSNRVPWTTRIRRWAFLSVKFLLIVVIVCFGSLDLAFWSGSVSADTAELLEGCSAFWGLLLAFRWALRDQRKRCPVCLCTLTNPARVGQFSRNFLAWNGTELVCLSGHGFLHVPDLSTSWFSSQRWLYLDSSWKGLFPVGT